MRKQHYVLIAAMSFIVLAIFTAMVAVVISAAKNKGTTSQYVPARNENKPKNESKAITQEDAEKFCQDAAILGNYIDTSKVKIVDMFNYNAQFFDSGLTNSKGEPVMVFQWNGEDSDGQVLFVCMVSGTKNKITLESLAIRGDSVYNILPM